MAHQEPDAAVSSGPPETGRNVALDAVTTSVATMACTKTDHRIFELVRDRVDGIILVDDNEMRRAAKWLWFEIGLAADLRGAAAIAALREKRFVVRPGGAYLCHGVRGRA